VLNLSKLSMVFAIPTPEFVYIPTQKLLSIKIAFFSISERPKAISTKVWWRRAIMEPTAVRL
jgi:hypothetical protein